MRGYLVKNYNVIFLPSFSKMFENTLNNCRHFSPTYALKIEHSLHDALYFLKLFPYATSTIKLKGNPKIYRKFVVQKRFLIVFKLTQNTIYLSYFIDGRQVPKKLFKIIY